MKDPAIKLFGKEIAVVTEINGVSMISREDLVGDKTTIKPGDEQLESDKDSQQDNFPPSIEEEETPDDPEDDPKTPPIIEENENDQNMTNSKDQSPLKKPDKILPCPRCNSMDTKFCYFNNYNVNQPRHFCKACQRYWTAGGTTRNVPVGAGRRKSKNSTSHNRNIIISDALHEVINPIYEINATVLSFGTETTKKSPIFQNKISKVENENGSHHSSGVSVITNSIGGRTRNVSGLPHQVPCIPSFPWPYPPMLNPGFCPPGYSIPVIPIPYWNCGYPIPVYPTPTSPLGKHSRYGELRTQINAENKEFKEAKSCESTILVPKTLRIDDPDEAAKSSIWATLGIKNDSINRKGMFKAFEPKDDGTKSYVPETPESMRANPAAMSRSLNFQERAYK